MRSPDEVKQELVRQWVAKAESDFGLAQRLVSESSPYLDAIGFHAQQAAEKYLKALLVQHQIEFPKTHNLGGLLDLVSAIDASLATSLRDVTALTPYGVDVRYPGDVPEMTAEVAAQTLALAAKVRDAVRRVLKGSV